jgi:transcriptional regulator with XRE-family HTH domain
LLEHLLEAKGVTQAAVARATGIAESRLSEVLRGKRELTRAQITKLAAYFYVGPAVFLASKDLTTDGPRR